MELNALRVWTADADSAIDHDVRTAPTREDMEDGLRSQMIHEQEMKLEMQAMLGADAIPTPRPPLEYKLTWPHDSSISPETGPETNPNHMWSYRSHRLLGAKLVSTLTQQDLTAEAPPQTSSGKPHQKKAKALQERAHPHSTRKAICQPQGL